MLSKKDLRSAEMDTLRRSRTTTTVVTAVQTTKEAQVYVRDLGLFVTVQLLEETAAVLLLGELCKHHGYSYEWVSGQKPRLTKEGKTITCGIDIFVPLVVRCLSSTSAISSSSTSRKQDKTSPETQEIRIDPTISENRSRTNPNMQNDSTVSGNRNETHPGTTRSDVTALGDPSGAVSDRMETENQSQDVPEWLQNFTENLEIPEILVPAQISQEGSDSECSTIVVENSNFKGAHF